MRRPPLLLLLAVSACASASGSPPPPTSPTPAGASTCDASTGCTGHAGLPETPGSRSVLGTALVPCPSRHATGFYRDGHCNTGPDDTGVHVVCAEVTQPFLEFTRSRGNDLSTPRPGFPGLQPGDGWCLCAGRWQEAFEAGVAPKVVLGATHEAALRTSGLEALRAHAAGPRTLPTK
jgi:uncharacterized protein (DUF2237 family)